MHRREGNPGFERETEGDGIAVVDVLGDCLPERAAFVRQRWLQAGERLSTFSAHTVRKSYMRDREVLS